MSLAPPVTIIVPTHAHHTTLATSVQSVLKQTMGDLAVIIIGDGVTDETRDVVAELRRSDARVSFVDRPKSPRTGEPYRHEVLATVTSTHIGYHGDDDLMLPHHLETMLAVVEDRDFAHPLSIYVDEFGGLRYSPIDLSKSAWVGAVYPPMNLSAISLTGVVHTLSSYRRLPYGWRTTPKGINTDHFMWQQYFALPHFRGATSPIATTVKLGAMMRRSATDAERGLEIESRWRRIQEPSFRQAWDAAVRDAVRSSRLRARLVYVAAQCNQPTDRRSWDALRSRVFAASRRGVPGLRTLPSSTRRPNAIVPDVDRPSQRPPHRPT